MAKSKRYYWLKLKQSFFTDKRVKLLKKIAGGDTYLIIYLKLMLLTTSSEGHYQLEGICRSPEEELALVIDEEPENIKICLNFLQNCGLYSELSDGVIFFTEVPKLIGDESESAQRVREFRAREKQKKIENNQKSLQCNADVTECNKNVTLDNKRIRDKSKDIYTLSINRESTSTFVDETPAPDSPEEVVESDVVVLDQEEELVKAKRDITPYNKILNEYNAICTSLPRAEKLSDKRKKAIKRVYTEYGFDQIITGFMKAQASDFLKGNAKDWQANFDWLMNVNNMLKVLEGNYDNKRQSSGDQSKEEFLREWGLA